MAKALGTTRDDEHQPGLSSLSRHLSGNVGLLFTSRPPPTVLSHFATYTPTDYARSGCTATRSFTLPVGTVFSRGGEIPTDEDVPLQHSQEPMLRTLLVPTRLVKGKITLDTEYEVCKEGQTLDSRQTKLLKMFGVAMAEFHVRIVA
jgi:mRNA turnover protein 4